MRFIRSKRKMAALVVALAAIVLIAVFVLYPHWWWQANASVYRNGILDSNAHVYVARKGYLAIGFHEHNSNKYVNYIFQPNQHWICSSNIDKFFFVPSGAFNRYGPDTWVVINAVKAQDPKLSVNGNTLRFNSLYGESIRVEVRDPALLNP